MWIWAGDATAEAASSGTADWVLVLLGGALSFVGGLLAFLLNLIQYRRQQGQRWERDLRELAAHLSVSAMAAYSDAAQRRDPEDNYRQMVQAFRELEILAPDEVGRAAREFVRTVNGRLKADDPSEDDHRLMAADVASTQRAFVNATRRALDIDVISEDAL